MLVTWLLILCENTWEGNDGSSRIAYSIERRSRNINAQPQSRQCGQVCEQLHTSMEPDNAGKGEQADDHSTSREKQDKSKPHDRAMRYCRSFGGRAAGFAA